MSGGLVYLLIVAIAFVNALVALSLSGLVAVYYIFESTPAHGKPGEPSEPGD
jgi:hypothetical protein